MGASCGLELADIVRQYGSDFRDQHAGQLSRPQLRVLSAIEQCRTAALGGHVYECDQCGEQVIVYNSCRNRHCPKCQSLAKERWLEQRREELLPVPYVHLVFTIPDKLHALARHNERWFYNLLFHSASSTLLTLAADPAHLGALVGVLAVLHTWTQRLTYHPHLHCIVPAGGLAAGGDRWVAGSEKYFLPVLALGRLFRGKFLHALKEAAVAGELVWPGESTPGPPPASFQALLDALYGQEWVVYCKPPFGGPEQVLRYLARYTHRVAISNHRLVRMEGDHVVFTWRDRADHDRVKEMALPADEFLRRFLLHVLPDRFVRIRYYGLLANRNRQEDLTQCRRLLAESSTAPPSPSPAPVTDWRALMQRLTGVDPTLCPKCGQGHLQPVREIAAVHSAGIGLLERAPP